jgi:hypothetical protein
VVRWVIPIITRKIWDIVVAAALDAAVVQDGPGAAVVQDALVVAAAMAEEEVGLTISIRIITTAVGRTSRRITRDKLPPTAVAKPHQRRRLPAE